jgi:hypothetical protein
MYNLLHYFLTPYQKPHPPIGVAAAATSPLPSRLPGNRASSR